MVQKFKTLISEQEGVQPWKWRQIILWNQSKECGVSVFRIQIAA